MDEYITNSGDTWDYISFKVYGSEKYMNELIKANIEHLEVVIFSANINLTIPKINIQSKVSLPPWKRGVDVI